MSMRYDKNVTRGSAVELIIDGQSVSAYEGETIAAVLLLANKTVCYRTRNDSPRMMFCNMGTCFECRVRVTQAGVSRWLLACTTTVEAQMKVDTGIDFSRWMPGSNSDV
ncbi:MAG: ferredoxin [Halieaceae bacterium]|jgi:ferredoxin